MSRLDRRQQTRLSCYLLFRRLFEFPGEDTYQLLEEDAHISLWNDFFGENNDGFHNIFSQDLPRLQRLKDKWSDDISPHRGRVKPVESLYKVWTTDPSCEMPFADEKGYLLSDWAQHMRHILQEIGIEIPDEYKSMPDFIGFELELMSILVEEDLQERQKLFLEQHLDWIPDMRKKAEEEQISVFYREMISILEEFIREEWRLFELDKSSAEKFKKFAG